MNNSHSNIRRSIWLGYRALLSLASQHDAQLGQTLRAQPWATLANMASLITKGEPVAEPGAFFCRKLPSHLSRHRVWRQSVGKAPRSAAARDQGSLGKLWEHLGRGPHRFHTPWFNSKWEEKPTASSEGAGHTRIREILNNLFIY